MQQYLPLTAIGRPTSNVAPAITQTAAHENNGHLPIALFSSLLSENLMHLIRTPQRLKQHIHRLAKAIIRSSGFEVIRANTFEELIGHAHVGRHIENFLDVVTAAQRESTIPSKLVKNLRYSTSQFRQDVFALSRTGYKDNGYFVEFGAADGRSASNTYLLEKAFGWTGILSEPAKVWHKRLRENRTCHIETRCVWSRSNELLSFKEVDVAELSTLEAFSESDIHRHARATGNHYNVETISLVDLLVKYHAPKVIDFLSIDTEGSEFEILNGFDFSEFQFKVIVCEHNYSSRREAIFEMLSQKGYERVCQELSRVDDWYVKRD